MVIIFQSGFEELPFTGVPKIPPWTANVGTPVVQAVTVHQGTYALECNANNEYTNATFAQQSTVYVRFYGRTTADCGANANDTFNWVWFVGTAVQVVAAFGRRNDAGVNKWCLRYRNGAGMFSAFSTVAFAVNTWYCIEIQIVVHGTAGIYRVWLNGTLIIEVTGVDSDNYGNISQVWIGMPNVTGAVPTVHEDCVVIADARIHCKGYGVGGLNPMQMAKVILGL